MVAAHKQFPMPKKDGYMPVLVGAVRNYRPKINYQRDDVVTIFLLRIQIIMNLLQFIGLGRI